MLMVKFWAATVIFLTVLGLVLLSRLAFAADGVLTWTANTETDLAGYKVYRAPQACSAQGPLAPLMKGSPPVQVQVGKVTTYLDAGLPPLDGTMCWEITAVDIAANESGRSNRVSKDLNTVPPIAPAGLGVAIQ
jgi:hypothetical protein